MMKQTKNDPNEIHNILWHVSGKTVGTTGGMFTGTRKDLMERFADLDDLLATWHLSASRDVWHAERDAIYAFLTKNQTR